MRPAIASLASAILLSAVLVAGCGQRAALDALAPGEGGTVASAPTGDSLVLEDGRKVRLAGVDAPSGDEPFAAEAQGVLQSLVVGRKVELLEGGADKDAYGRTIAQVREPERGLWVEAELLRLGAARVRTYPDNRAMVPRMLEAEAEARKAGRGLWALPAYRVLLPEEVGRERRGFVLVEGWATRLARQGDRALILFGPSGFAAEIPRSAWDDLTAAGLTPEALKGRLLRVRGNLSQGPDGPRLWIDHPEQIERLKPPLQRSAPGEPKSRTPGARAPGV